DGVILRLTVALRPLPRPLDPALLLEANERGIQGPLIERQRMLGDLLEARGEPVSMLGPHRGERPQDDQIERALEKFDAFSHSTPHPSEVGSSVPWALLVCQVKHGHINDNCQPPKSNSQQSGRSWDLGIEICASYFFRST